MKIVVEDIKNFKDAVNAVVNLIDEGSFDVGPGGMHLRAMDPSQIALVDLELPKEFFTGFDVDEKLVVSLNLTNFSKILSTARTGEKLSIGVNDDSSKLSLEFKGESKRRISVPLLDLNYSEVKEPKVPFDAFVKLNAGALKGMLGDAGLLSSHVVFEASDLEFIVEARGDSGDVRIETDKNSQIIKEFKVQNTARAMFPFEYLDNMTKSCSSDGLIELALKTDAPIRINYLVGKAKLSYYLAPRVETI